MFTGNSFTQKNHTLFCLLGAVSGDVIGSVYEFSRQKKYDFPLFSRESKITDDSVLTIAIADAILHDRDYLDFIRKYAQAYPDSGYGGFFRKWMYSDNPQPYSSFGNGSAMRVSAVGWAFDTVEQVLLEAQRSSGLLMIILRESRVRKLRHWQFFWRAKAQARKPSSRKSLRALVMIWIEQWIKFALRMNSRKPARRRSLKPPLLFLNQRITKMPSAKRFLWVAMQIHWRQSPVQLPKPITVACQQRSA
jgi:hypothetical protein